MYSTVLLIYFAKLFVYGYFQVLFDVLTEEINAVIP